MANDRATLAINRLERALARVERGIAAKGSSTTIHQNDPDLEERHALLRKEVSVALAQIDRLITSARQNQHG